MRKLRLDPAVWGILVGVAIAYTLAACAAHSKAPVASRADAASPPPAMVDRPESPRDQIQKLMIEIEDWRVEKKWSKDPLNRYRSPDILSQPVKEIRECPAPATEACDDVCTLRERICENAEDICRIAGELGDDEWAKDKCDKAKASCKEASEKCCSCEPKK